MKHIGIDLGASHSHVVVISTEDGRETGLSRCRVETGKLPAWLSRQPAGRVVMEACTQSPAVARAAVSAGHDTRVVPGNVVRALGVGARGIKTDDRDAEVLARASTRNEDLPSVHLRSEASRSRRELTSARAALLNARKSLALHIKSWLRGRLVRLKGRASSKRFCEVVRRVALQDPEGLPKAIEVLLTSYEQLTAQIAELTEEIAELAKGDAVCQRLMTMPGVGPQIAVAFCTYVDDPNRFSSASELGSYLALVPGEATTGGKVVRTGTIKAGPKYLKALLVQGAWTMLRTRPNDPVVLWARGLAEKRGKRIAVVALARKMATILWSMWKHDRSYDPARASSVRASRAGQSQDKESRNSVALAAP